VILGGWPAYMVKQIGTLLAHLDDQVPHSVDITNATALPLWTVQKYRENGVRYGIWAAADACESVRWAYIPCPRILNRQDAIAFLRLHWAPDARRFLAALEDQT